MTAGRKGFVQFFSEIVGIVDDPFRYGSKVWPRLLRGGNVKRVFGPRVVPVYRRRAVAFGRNTFFVVQDGAPSIDQRSSSRQS